MTVLSADPNAVRKVTDPPGVTQRVVPAASSKAPRDTPLPGEPTCQQSKAWRGARVGLKQGKGFCPGPMPFGMRRWGQVGRRGAVGELNPVYREAPWPLTFWVRWPF